MNIFLLKHKLDFSVDDDVLKVKEYFKRKLELDISIQVQETLTKPVDAWKEAIKYEGTYDMVGYIFDRKGYGFLQAQCSLVTPKLPYLYLPILKIEDDLNYLWMLICHEIMHGLHHLVKIRLGVQTKDSMDLYDWNWDLEHPNGNFARNIKELKPHIKTLFKPATSPLEARLVSKWGMVPLLETKADEFLEKAKQAGFNLKITHGYRDPIYQDKLYAQGRTIPGKIVTNATGKTSKHCQGKAFDIAFVGKDPYPKNANWKAIGAIGKSLGLKWGGDWNTFIDRLHFEL